MASLDPIAFTYEADVHCPACTFARFGREVQTTACRVCREPGNTVPFSLAHRSHRHGPRAGHDFDPVPVAWYPWPPESARDREDNPIGAVSPWDDWCSDCQNDEPSGSHSLECADCHATIREHDPVIHNLYEV